METASIRGPDDTRFSLKSLFQGHVDFTTGVQVDIEAVEQAYAVAVEFGKADLPDEGSEDEGDDDDEDDGDEVVAAPAKV